MKYNKYIYIMKQNKIKLHTNHNFHHHLFRVHHVLPVFLNQLKSLALFFLHLFVHIASFEKNDARIHSN